MTRVLKLDIDIPFEVFMSQLYNDFVKTRKKILKLYGLRPVSIKVTRSTNNTHVLIEVNKDISIEEAIRLQYLLGDDPHRYMYNLMRLKYFGEKTALFFNILFTEKEELKGDKR